MWFQELHKIVWLLKFYVDLADFNPNRLSILYSHSKADLKLSEDFLPLFDINVDSFIDSQLADKQVSIWVIFFSSFLKLNICY